MKPVSVVRPVTVIREQFTLSSHVKRALNRFTDGPTSEFRAYSGAQCVVDQVEYHAASYDHQIKYIQERLKEMGRRALMLSGRTRIAGRHDGGVRLLFEPREPEYLQEMANLLRTLPALESPRLSERLFYVDFAKNSLVKSVRQQQDAQDMFSAEARHPVMQKLFTVSNPTVVSQDLPLYRIDASDT